MDGIPCIIVIHIHLVIQESRVLYVNLIDSKNQQLVWQGKGVGVLNEYSK